MWSRGSGWVERWRKSTTKPAKMTIVTKSKIVFKVYRPTVHVPNLVGCEFRAEPHNRRIHCDRWSLATWGHAKQFQSGRLVRPPFEHRIRLERKPITLAAPFCVRLARRILTR